MFLRKTTIIISLTLFLGLAIFGLIKHRDRHQVLLERIDPDTYITSDLPKLVYLNSLVNDHTNLFLRFLESHATYECLNGKDPSKLDPKEQLIEFIQGPCLPVVAIPGLLASRLSVKIDCQTFQANNPDIFSTCGWTTCDWWKVWESMPNEDYVLWISDFLGPLSVVFNSTVRCWGNIIQLYYDVNEEDITRKYSSPVGVNITIYEERESQNSKCGFEAVNNILPGPYQTLYSKGYQGLYDSLLKMGYQVGLNLYATPYDWRKTTMANGITNTLNETIRRIYDLTGKPSILIAHSLGNFGALHLLNSLSKEEKDKYIANYVSVTNPLAGSPKAVKTLIGGDQEYTYRKYGVNYYAQRKLVSDSSGGFDVVPKDPYTFFANSSWLQEWQTRSDLENRYDVRTEEGKKVWEEVVNNGSYTYKWFPHPLLNCSYGFEQRRDECGLYMYNWSAQPLAIIKDEIYTGSEQDLKSLIEDYALVTNISEQLFNDCKTNNVYLLSNPEVPVTLIYGSHLQTDMTFEWDYDPRENARQDEFAFPNVTYSTQGDQTVPTSSALLPALKWSWEFDNKIKSGVLNAKPVKTVEICSIHNNKADIYDDKPVDGPYSTTTNEYIGLQCDCFTQKHDHPVLGQSCDHGDILNDSKFLNFITQIVNANYKISNVTSLIVNELTNEDLQIIAQNCPSVNSNSNSFDKLLSEAASSFKSDNKKKTFISS